MIREKFNLKILINWIWKTTILKIFNYSSLKEFLLEFGIDEFLYYSNCSISFFSSMLSLGEFILEPFTYKIEERELYYNL